MTQVVCYIPPSNGAPIFRDRLWNWGRFISGNCLRDYCAIFVFLPEQYRGDEYVALFGEGEVIFYDEDRYKLSDADQLLVDYASEDETHESTRIFVLAGFRNPFGKAGDRSVALHFEMGIFSRSPMPPLVRYDSGGFFFDSSIKDMRIDRISSDIVELLIELAGLAEKLYYVRRSIVPVDVERWYLSNCDERPLFMFAAPPAGDHVSSLILNAPYEAREFIERLSTFVPRFSRVIVTRHPSDSDVMDLGGARLRNGVVASACDFGSSVPVTQMLLPYVCGVVTISSMVGVQAKLLRKQLYAHEGGVAGGVADATFSNDVMNVRRSGTSQWDFRVRVGYILAFLHLPSSIWNGGYGRLYVNRLIEGRAASELWELSNAREHIRSVVEFYTAEIGAQSRYSGHEDVRAPSEGA